MATSKARAQQKAMEVEIKDLRGAIKTVSQAEALEIRQVIEKYEKNELSNDELEQVLRRFNL